MRLAPVWLALTTASILIGCGASGEERTTQSAFAATTAAEERKLRRLQRQLRRQRQGIDKAREKSAARVERPPGAPENGSVVSSHGFSALESRLPGAVGATIGPPGQPASLRVGGLGTGSAWSTIKVPIALAVLRDMGGPGGLRPSQAADIRAALTLSDNKAAADLFAGLERRHGGTAGAAAAVNRVLRQAGDAATNVSTKGRDGFSPYGQTDWTLRAQHLFMSRLAGGCLEERRSGRYVLRLMGEVSSDTWGLGAAGLAARWKGGWGPGVDGRYLVRQMGVFEVDGRRAVVTLAAIPDDGSFESAQSIATSVASWLARKAVPSAGIPGRC